MKRLMDWFRYLIIFVWPQKPQPQVTHAQSEPAPPPQSAPAASPEPPKVEARQAEEARNAPAEPPLGPNRKERRRLAKWERERRKHDIFVKPAVPESIPLRKPRAKRDEDKPKRETVPDPTEGVPLARELIDGEDGKIYPEEEWQGEFNFRDTILEQLELYWGYLQRMKHHDPDAYDFYKQVGATIVPPITHFLHAGPIDRHDEELVRISKTKKIELTPWWKENRPGCGCISYGLTRAVEEAERATLKEEYRRYIPKFFYFLKFNRPPPEVQPMSGGDVYKLTIWWDQPFNKRMKKGGTPTDYAVFLDKETIKVLRMLDTKMVRVGKRGNNFNYELIPQRAWRIPEYYKGWAKDEDEDVEHMLARMFMEMSSCFERANYSMVRVAVHNGDLTAQFSVDPRRMSYFFQDRDIVYTPGGAREHCFHIVRAHERHYANGKVSPVRLHFSGAKEFTWAGYRVTVTVPERDHLALPDFDVPVSDTYWHKRGEKYVSMKGIGAALAKTIAGETPNEAFKAAIDGDKRVRQGRK